MSSHLSFEKIKNTIFSLSDHLAVDHTDQLNVTGAKNVDDAYHERLTRLFASYADAQLAAQRNDRTMLKAALLQAKMRAMSLTTFFTALEDDCITLLSLCDGPLTTAGQGDNAGEGRPPI
ncbi:hypothetical protein [Acerihabitans arboris]|uniref:Uncharacterized protein n=1 Tax=Acerihabitans arboris TaxID=2691583 RepID=A0A845SNJ1_9GAMM|nr:hypothetical protein [Acerihabitans arboris]NDL62785.1 hypothetical protein [Acerihabitans arboris]